MLRLSAIVLAATSLQLTLPVDALADEPCVSELDEFELEERTRTISSALDDNLRRARWWWAGWTSITGSAAIYNIVSASIADDRDDRIVAAMSGIGPFVGSIALGLRPFETAFAAPRLRESPLEGVERLRLAESLLLGAARRERMDRAWFRHVAIFAYASTIALVATLRLNEPLTGLRLFLMTAIGGEVQLLTTPRGATRALADYRRDYGLLSCP